MAPARRAAAPRTGGDSGRGGGARRLRGRIPRRLVTQFTVQLANLTGAGIPIVRALGILEGQCRPGPFKELLADLVEDVAAGTPLSDAVGKHDRAFDPLYASMVRAGEAGGVLDTVLRRLAAFREKAARIKSQVGQAMVYPLIVVSVVVVVVSVVNVFVIPKFNEIFQSFDMELPELTRILLGVSQFSVDYWYAVFLPPLLLVLLHLFLMRRGGRYRFRVHWLLLKVPVVGDVVAKSLVAAFSRTFGTLLEAGVPHLEALGIVRDTTGNEVLSDAVEHVRRTVREGEGVSAPMAETGVFDDLVVNMVAVGEESGELDAMLLRVAGDYEEEVDRSIDVLFKGLEPALVILVAVFVGVIVVALFLPLMDLMNSLQGRA